MPKYEVLRDYIIGSSAGNYRLRQGNVLTLPNDEINQRRINLLLTLPNPVLKEWVPPDEFKDKKV